MKEEKKKYRLKTAYLEAQGIGKVQLAEMTGASELTVSRWYSGAKIPSLENLTNLAWTGKTNISYLIGLCEVDRPLERCNPHMRVSQLRKEKDYTVRTICEVTGLNWYTIQNCEKNESFDPDKKMPTLSTLITLCEAFDVSLDYILGLSDYRKWEEQEKSSPFLTFPPGYAIHIKTDDLDTDCLIGDNGVSVVFPNGEMMSVYSEKLAFATVYDIREEARRRRSMEVL